MNIGSVGRGAAPERARPLGAAGNEVGEPRSVSDASVDGEGVRVSLSKPVQMVSQLEDLKKNDFEAFSRSLTESAQQLQRAAEEAGGDDREQLATLAQSFAHAAASGDLSALKPPTEDRARSREADREVTGNAGRALAEYAKNTPERAPRTETMDRAMSATFARIDQAARTAAAGEAKQATARTSLYA